MRFLPRGVAGRSILVMLLAVALVHIGSVALYEISISSTLGSGWIRDVAERIVSARLVLEQRPAGQRDAVTHDLSSGSLRLHWTLGQPTIGCAVTGEDTLGLNVALADVMKTQGMSIPQDAIAGAEHGDRAATVGCLFMTDGSALAFRVVPHVGVGAETHAALLSTTVMVLGIVALAGMLMRRVTAPLRRLVLAADAIGRTATPAPVSEDGPDEIRNVALAFNAMQMRIQRLVNDRTQALAAVSHDLRTPITRLRLRAGFINDPAMQKQIDADLDEMEAMVGATLAHLPRLMNVPALLATLVDDATDAGYQAIYEGPAHATAVVRPFTLKRALGNLIHNAVVYGGVARVKLQATPEGMDIDIEDDGPGIPPAELDRVFEPFQRLEPSRNRSTGGVGLGLTIARQAILTEGGTLWLENRSNGGLTAHVRLVDINALRALNVGRALRNGCMDPALPADRDDNCSGAKISPHLRLAFNRRIQNSWMYLLRWMGISPAGKRICRSHAGHTGFGSRS